MKVGFTGTRVGMTKAQKQGVLDALARLVHIEEFHHGDCHGADTEAHTMIRRWYPKCRIVIHPSDKVDVRSFCRGDVGLQPKPPLIRNHDIVDAVDHMICAPREVQEQMRSGTWATIRYTKKCLRNYVIVFPDYRGRS